MMVRKSPTNHFSCKNYSDYVLHNDVVEIGGPENEKVGVLSSVFLALPSHTSSYDLIREVNSHDYLQRHSFAKLNFV